MEFFVSRGMLPQVREMLPAQLIQRWIIDNKEIILLKNENSLNYNIFDNITGETIQGPINLDGHSIDAVISYLLQCQPKISENGEISFSSGPRAHFTWTFKNNEIQLLQKNDDLIWQLFDKSTRTISETPFHASFLKWEPFSRLYGCSENEYASLRSFLNIY